MTTFATDIATAVIIERAGLNRTIITVTAESRVMLTEQRIGSQSWRGLRVDEQFYPLILCKHLDGRMEMIEAIDAALADVQEAIQALQSTDAPPPFFVPCPLGCGQRIIAIADVIHYCSERHAYVGTWDGRKVAEGACWHDTEVRMAEFRADLVAIGLAAAASELDGGDPEAVTPVEPEPVYPDICPACGSDGSDNVGCPICAPDVDPEPSELAARVNCSSRPVARLIAQSEDAICSVLYELLLTDAPAAIELLRSHTDRQREALAERYAAWLRARHGITRVPSFILRGWSALLVGAAASGMQRAGEHIVRQWTTDRDYFLRTLAQMEPQDICQMAGAAVAFCAQRVPWSSVTADQMLAAWQAAALAGTA